MPARIALPLAAVWLAPVLLGTTPLWPLLVAMVALRIVERLLFAMSGFGIAAAIAVAILLAVGRR